MVLQLGSSVCFLYSRDLKTVEMHSVSDTLVGESVKLTISCSVSDDSDIMVCFELITDGLLIFSSILLGSRNIIFLHPTHNIHWFQCNENKLRVVPEWKQLLVYFCSKITVFLSVDNQQFHKTSDYGAFIAYVQYTI